MIVAGIDGGKHASAVAVADRGRVYRLDWIHHRDIAGAGPNYLIVSGLRTVVAEKPQHDGRPASAQTLIDLSWGSAAAAFWLAARHLAHVVELEPREWKGQEPKPVHHMRVWAALDPTERALFPANTEAQINAAADKAARWPRGKKKPSSWYPASFKSHNHLCAAGLVLVSVGRLKRGT